MFDLWGWRIHLYGLLIGLGVWLALEAALTKTKKAEEKRNIESLFGWVVLGGVIGARMYHVIDYWQRYYSQSPIKIFYVWEGGLGIWGAILGGMTAIGIFSLIKKRNFLGLSDGLIVGVPLAQAVGRLGNWVNGELYGKNGEPLFAYEAILNLVLFGILWKQAEKKEISGRLTGIYLAGYGLIRVLLEGMRPTEIIWKIGSIPTAVILGIISTAAGLYLIFRKQS